MEKDLEVIILERRYFRSKCVNTGVSITENTPLARFFLLWNSPQKVFKIQIGSSQFENLCNPYKI